MSITIEPPTIEAPAPFIPGVYEGMDFDQYLAICAVSSTMLKAFILKSPRAAKAVLDGSDKPESRTLVIGTAEHAAVLQPDEFDRIYKIGPDVNRNTREWKDFDARCEAMGWLALKPAEYRCVLTMRDNVLAEPWAAKLLNACDRREMTILWNDAATGLACKCRIDLYSTRTGVMPDLKTAADASQDEFEKAAARYGYPIQLPWYARGLQSANLPCNAVGFIVVENQPPHDVMVYSPDMDWFVYGEGAIQRAMVRLADCFEKDEWPGYMHGRKPATLTLPRWWAERYFQ